MGSFHQSSSNIRGSFHNAESIEQYGFQQYQLGKQKLEEMKKKMEEQNQEQMRVFEEKLKAEMEVKENAR